MNLLAIAIILLQLVFNGTVVKKEVTYVINSDNTIFATVTFTDDQGATLDGWPGGHFLNDEEKALFNSDNREILDKKFTDHALKLKAERDSKIANPVPLTTTKIEVTAQVEQTAINKQAAIDEAKAAAAEPKSENGDDQVK